MANSNGWGDGSVNNNIGWGQGANNSTGWGKSHLNSWSGATDIDGGNPPVNSVAPALSGTAQEGQTLTCSAGTWSGSPTYTYQWKRDGNNITSATNSTYILVTADVGTSIKCTVTATNFTGSATADSNTVIPTSSVDADAQAFITAASITDPTQQSAINTLVTDLKGYGIWTKMKALYPFVGGTATTHKFNLKDPRDLDAAFRLTYGGSVTHNSNGITGGINGFCDTKVNDQNNLSIDNKHIAMYQRNILADPSGSSMGTSGNLARFYLNFAGSNYSTLGMSQAPFAVQTPQRGMFVMSKTASGSFKYYQNALTPVTRTGTNASANNNHFLLACNNGSGGGADYTVANLAFVSLGDGLSDTDVTNLRTAVISFQTTLSRNV